MKNSHMMMKNHNAEHWLIATTFAATAAVVVKGLFVRFAKGKPTAQVPSINSPLAIDLRVVLFLCCWWKNNKQTNKTVKANDCDLVGVAGH